VSGLSRLYHVIQVLVSADQDTELLCHGDISSVFELGLRLPPADDLLVLDHRIDELIPVDLTLEERKSLGLRTGYAFDELFGGLVRLGSQDVKDFHIFLRNFMTVSSSSSTCKQVTECEEQLLSCFLIKPAAMMFNQLIETCIFFFNQIYMKSDLPPAKLTFKKG
jgi:hypothetical protein